MPPRRRAQRAQAAAAVAAGVPPPPPVNSVVETKVAASSGTAIGVGLLTWALTYFIPAWHSGIPGPLLPFIPVAAAWLTSTGASYFAPHTHRPDLAPLPVAAIAAAPAEPAP